MFCVGAVLILLRHTAANAFVMRWVSRFGGGSGWLPSSRRRRSSGTNGYHVGLFGRGVSGHQHLWGARCSYSCLAGPLRLRASQRLREEHLQGGHVQEPWLDIGCLEGVWNSISEIEIWNDELYL